MSAILANFKRRTFTRNGVTVKVSRSQFLIMAALLAACGAPLSRDDLVALLYGDDQKGGPLWAVGSLRVSISRLRHADGRAAGALPRLCLVITCGSRGNLGYRIKILDAGALLEEAA